MGLKQLMTLVFVFGSLGVLPGPAQAQSEAMECVSDGPDNVMCMSLPVGSVEKSVVGRVSPTRQTKPQSQLSMITKEELQGLSTSLETQADANGVINPATEAEISLSTKEIAAREALETTEKLQELEQFLNITERTGGTGDLSVITSGRKE